jgi:hypothetical protein
MTLILVAGAGASTPATGGTDTALAAPSQTSASGQPASGDLVFGGQSRIQIEFDDDTVEVFYLLEVLNPSSGPITPAHELVFDLPDGAEQASALEGSSTQLTVRGRRVMIVGPFASGTTQVQLAYTLPPGKAERQIVQRFPIPWAQVQIIVSKVGQVTLTSPQAPSATEVPNEGHKFLLATGPTLSAGRELMINLTGVPSRTHRGRWIALALALMILAAGTRAAVASGRVRADTARRAQLMERRERLLADLVRLESQHRAGEVDDTRYAARRSDLVAQLERVYGELDQQSGTPDRGLAA